jgi:hypothetical protein
MRVKFLLALSLFAIAFANAQDKKWSIEANYPISASDDFGNDVPGIFDVGVKYRFLNTDLLRLGVGINTSLFSGNVNSSDVDNTIDLQEKH